MKHLPSIIKAYHPSNPDVCTYLFGIHSKLNIDDVEAISKQVAESSAFQQSDCLVIEIGDMHAAKKGHAAEGLLSAESEEEDLEHKIKLKNTVDTTLVEAAKVLNKPTYPLDSPKNVRMQQAKMLFHGMTDPHNINKASLLSPLGPIAAVGYYLKQRKDIKRDLKNGGRLYREGRVSLLMNQVYAAPNSREYLLRQRNQKWLTDVYRFKTASGKFESTLAEHEGLEKDPKRGRFSKFFKPHKSSGVLETTLLDLMERANLFLAVSIGHIHDKDYGLITELEALGYQFETIELNNLDEEASIESEEAARHQFAFK